MCVFYSFIIQVLLFVLHPFRRWMYMWVVSPPWMYEPRCSPPGRVPAGLCPINVSSAYKSETQRGHAEGAATVILRRLTAGGWLLLYLRGPERPCSRHYNLFIWLAVPGLPAGLSDFRTLAKTKNKRTNSKKYNKIYNKHLNNKK